VPATVSDDHKPLPYLLGVAHAAWGYPWPLALRFKYQHGSRRYALHLLGEVVNLRLSRTNCMCALDNAVSLDGAKRLVSYLEEYTKSA
jgi:hypothetical protein